MRFELVRNLKGEEVLAKAVLDNEGKLLLKSGVKLTRSQANLLKQNGIFFVYVEDKNLEDIGPNKELSKFKETALKSMPGVFRGLCHSEGKAVEESLVSVDNLVEFIIRQGDINTNLYELNQYDDYTYIHCIDTGIMAVFLGKSLELSMEELKNLGISAMLHDIGKIKISDKIINKKGPLNPEEYEEIRKHPIYGYNILKDAGVKNIEILSAVIEHHEKVNGTGYPLAIKGNKITKFAKIISVCDVFTAVSANRSYRSRFSPNEAYEYVISGMGTSFDEEVIEKFRQTFAIYPLGCAVKLSNGIEGYVVKQNKFFADRPVVRVTYDHVTRKNIIPYEINLLDYKNIIVESVV